MKHNMNDNRQNVLELQSFLRANNLLEGGIVINPDGIFDSATTTAVRLFQRQNGLEETGRVDYATWTMLADNAALLCAENGCLLINLDRTARR